jgi:hypothetical protein
VSEFKEVGNAGDTTVRVEVLVSIFERQRENEPEEGWPEGDLHPSQVLLAISETIGQSCSVCRSRHGSEVHHAAE